MAADLVLLALHVVKAGKLVHRADCVTRAIPWDRPIPCRSPGTIPLKRDVFLLSWVWALLLLFYFCF